MPKLSITADDGSERIVELTERTLQIGRGPGNDIVLADASHGVSRTHAELRFRNGRCVIVDLQSQNGTWLNGQRVQHAEVPPDAEIMVGNFRLRVIESESTPVPPQDLADPGSHAPRAGTRPRTTEDAALDVPIVRPSLPRAEAPLRQRITAVQGLLLAGFVVAVGAFTWWMLAPPAPVAMQTGTGLPGAMVEPLPATASATPSAEPPAPPLAAAPANDPSAAGGATVPKNGAGRPPVVSVRPDAPPVTRRPGESTEAWKARTAAFQTRYDYSRAALDRGDFAAAAGGFEAILREEPGFMDVPQLLLRARAGLRAAAVDVYNDGLRLEAAGEWLGALQKFDQARQVHADIAGLAPATRRVRDKLRAAGTTAFARARQYDAKGQTQDALKEYEKAVQWLPVDDPNRGIAAARVDQLKRAIQ